MKNSSKIGKLVRHVCGEFIILLAPNTLSILHLSSFHKSSVMLEKKELLKLSKKMVKIVSQLSESDFYNQSEEIQDPIKLFYEVYSRKNDLTVRKLKILRDYYDLIKSHYNFMSIQYREDGNSLYNSYDDILDELIDKKRLRKTLN